MTETMTHYFDITTLTKEFGITTRTLRFYEDKGLISPKREGRKRLYRPRDRVRLKLILRGKRLGFSLSEIQDIIDMYEAPLGEQGQLELLRQSIDKRQEELEAKRRDIDETLQELATVKASCEHRLKEIQT